MKTSILALGALLILGHVAPAFAGTSEGIAAVVNDSVISKSDVAARARLVVMGAHLPGTEETYKRIKPQILSSLINEALQMQEAASLGITITQEEIDKGFATIAANNEKSAEEFARQLQAGGISIDTLYTQIRVELAWGDVVKRKLRSQVSISESDIDAALDEIQTTAGRNEYLVADIFLAVDAPEKQGDVKAKADKLLADVQKGVPFAALARQFSQAPGAQNGGDLGWVREGQLQEDLDRALAALKPGQISPPILAKDGYHLLFLRDAKTRNPIGATLDGDARIETAHLKQVFIPVEKDEPDAVVAAKVARLKQLQTDVVDCDILAKRSVDFPSKGTSDLGTVQVSQIPAPLLVAIKDLEIGRLSDPIKGDDGLAALMVCQRSSTSTPEIASAQVDSLRKDQHAREKIANKLGGERLQILQDQYLKDLRATAYIDQRI